MESEQQLIEAAQSDKTQFVKLYDQNIQKIYRFILTRVADRDLAEDITSETFMKALEKIDSFKWTGKPFSAWLYRIAINQINQHYRQKKKDYKLMQQEWHKVGETFDHADAAMKEEEDKKEQLQNIQGLNTAFRELKAHDQDILSLKYFENLSYKEIADVLNITVSHVGVKINRATKRLSELCKIPLT